MSEIISLLENNDFSTLTTSEVGAIGEQLAQDYLLDADSALFVSTLKLPSDATAKAFWSTVRLI